MSNQRTQPPPSLSRQLKHAFRVRGREECLRLRWQTGSVARAFDVDRRVVIGSAENADVVVTDPTVSRLHAEIDFDAKGAFVHDLGSLNGTFVDRVEVRWARLHVGQTLRVGSISLSVEETALAPHERAVELWPEPKFGPLVGRSRVMREMFAVLAQVAETDAPVLIHGETGTGKELVARAIHERSARASRPYVVVDCAALQEHLLESELFGHARGAFTGATTAREGAIEAANGGTVFLDEIGELSIDMQPKLLRVLEQHTVRRLGETAHRPVDVRFVAATHRDLLESVARGEFREDLYFRLAVLPVTVPLLRERLDDLELLVRHFVGPNADSLLTPALMNELSTRPWRGNVRELRNFLQRASTFGIDHALRNSAARLTPERADEGGPERLAVAGASSEGIHVRGDLLALSHREFRERWSDLGEREFLKAKLASCDGNVSKLAREISLARTYAHKLIKKHEL